MKLNSKTRTLYFVGLLRSLSLLRLRNCEVLDDSSAHLGVKPCEGCGGRSYQKSTTVGVVENLGPRPLHLDPELVVDEVDKSQEWFFC